MVIILSIGTLRMIVNVFSMVQGQHPMCLVIYQPYIEPKAMPQALHMESRTYKKNIVIISTFEIDVMFLMAKAIV